VEAIWAWLLLASAGCVILLIRQLLEPSIFHSDFQRIECGMSLAEVEGIVGRKSETYCHNGKVIGHFEEMDAPDGMSEEEAVSEFLAFSARIVSIGKRPPSDPRFGSIVGWEIDRATMIVYVNEASKVRAKAYLPCHPFESDSDRILRLFKNLITR
jgi:hypothetical protein